MRPNTSLNADAIWRPLRGLGESPVNLALGFFVKTAVALLVQSVVFWSAVALVPAGLVSPVAWRVLYAITSLGFLCSCFLAKPEWSAYGWLAVAFYSVFFAVVFYGLNEGLDILHGATRPKAQLVQHLGGLEIWFFLCPGVLVFALARAVRALLSPTRQQPAS